MSGVQRQSVNSVRREVTVKQSGYDSQNSGSQMMDEDEMRVTMKQVHNTIEHIIIQLHIIEFTMLTNENNWLGRHTSRLEIYHIHTLRQAISYKNNQALQHPTE